MPVPDQRISTKTRRNAKKFTNSRSAIKTSVIVTVYNLSKEVDEIFKSLLSALKKRKDCEIIFVDDGSDDGTWAKLKDLGKRKAVVKLLRLRNHFDESSSFDAGLKYAVGENIVFFNARVRVNPEQIGQLVDKLDEGYDLVMGWRYPRRDSELNQTISKIFNWMVKKTSNIDVHDINSGVFATRRIVLEDIPFYGNLNIFIPLTAAQRGYRVTDAKIEQLPGKFRQSKYITEYFHRLLDIITVTFLTKYSKKPLHFLGFVGITFAVLGALMNLYLFFYRILGIGPIAGRPLLLLGALLLVIGVQMISIGLIGEMIIFTHAKEIKEYTIEEILD